MAKRYPGWAVVWVAFTLAVLGYGVSYSGTSVFLATLHETTSWPISTISIAITAQHLISAACVAFLPELYRRVPVATVSTVGAVLMAAGVVAWSSATEPWHLAGAALLGGLGSSTVSAAAINTIVARWFDRDRPKAISLALNGVSVSGMVMIPLWVALISLFGFPRAAALVAAVLVVVLCPLSWLYLRRGPEDFGLGLDGRIEPSAVMASAAAPPRSRRELMRERRVRTLTLAFAIASFAQVGLLAHFLTRMAPDLGATYAALAFSLMMAVSIVSRTALGWFVGGRDRRLIAATSFLVQVLGAGLMAVSRDPLVLAAACVIFGIGVGNLMTLPPLIAQQEFEKADIGTVVSLVSATNQSLFAFAPATLGILRDATGGYQLPFMVIAAAMGVAAVLILSGRQTKPS